jgi:uncharacterized protein (TIGR02246 family)
MTLSAEDRLDVLELVARADDAATARDVATYVALFTTDCVLDGAEGEHRGKEALIQAVGPIWAAEGPESTHLTLNVVIEAVTGTRDEAVANSTLMIVTKDSPVLIRTVTRIVQHLVKVDERWLISRRSVAG